MDTAFRETVPAIVRSLDQKLESLYCYPAVLSTVGLVAVLHDDTSVPFAVARIREFLPTVPLHCLRHNELFTLALPGQFIYILPDTPNEHPHVLYALRREGRRLWGADLRQQFPRPLDPRTLLDAHIERCLFYLRNNCILLKLMKQQYASLVRELDLNLRHLMATALLSSSLDCVAADEIAETFHRQYPDRNLRSQGAGFRAIVTEAAGWHPAQGRDHAMEAVWLFEQFLRRLRTIPI